MSRFLRSWALLPSRSVVVLIVLIGLTLILGWFSTQLDLILTFCLCVILLILWALSLRGGWTTLFGPVLFYDLIRQARRTRYFWIRLSYVCGLFVILWMYYESWSPGIRSYGIRTFDPSGFVESFFFTFLLVQLILVVMIVPAYVAGAITDEKEKKTIYHLLATDLHVHEIVLSKFLSRLGNVFLVILAGLPILSFLQFLGGIDPELLLIGYLGTGITILSLTGFSLLCSSLLSRSRDAIVLGYLIVPLYLGLDALLLALSSYGTVGSFPSTNQWTSPFTFSDLATAFHAGNPFAAYRRLTDVLSGNAGLRTETPWDILGEYALFHGLVMILSLAGAIVGLRRSTIHEASIDKGKGGRLRRGWFFGGRPEVFEQNPMLWKELLSERGVRWHWLMRVILGLGVLLSFAPAVRAFIQAHPYYSTRMQINEWVRITGTIVAMLLLFAVAVRGASSITGERERGTWEALILTRLTPTEILQGKWIGTVLGIGWGWVWLGSIWMVGLVTGGLSILMLPLLILVWAIYASLFALVGIWFSQKCRSTLRASVGAISMTLALSVGHWLIWLCCIPMQMGGAGLDGLWKLQAGCTPPVMLVMLAMSSGESASGMAGEMMGYGLVGVMVWSGGFLWLWHINRDRLEETTGVVHQERSNVIARR